MIGGVRLTGFLYSYIPRFAKLTTPLPHRIDLLPYRTDGLGAASRREILKRPALEAHRGAMLGLSLLVQLIAKGNYVCQIVLCPFMNEVPRFRARVAI